MKDKPIITPKEAAHMVTPGSTIMVGGFMGCGSPHTIIDALIESKTDNLTLICNDTAYPDFGVGKLVVSRQLTKVIASHVGTNKETGKQMGAGELEVDLIPQGTLAEQVRSAGVGLGGVLTPTGVGTIIEEEKEVIEIDGNKFLLELPINADIAIIKAHMADTTGNLVYRGSAVNFNPLMAMAGKTVIVEAEEIVEKGSIDPQLVSTPGIFIDYIVQGGKDEQ